jgi:predicted outer membrane protein
MPFLSASGTSGCGWRLARLIRSARRRIALPGTPNATQQSQARALAHLWGQKFNLTRDNDQIAGHQLSISATSTEISKGSAPAVTSFARYYLPIAKMHLAMANKLHRQLT